ncbi:MAG: YncE family protein [Mariniphaga sp.]|nr:YncE family protein [Mariniphaga sp.]
MKHFLKIVFLLALAWSCTDEPVETVFFDLDTENGIFIACEGNFMYGNGSLSFYHPHKKEVTNHLFQTRNNAPLGDVVQSLARNGNSLFIVVNNSGKIVVTNSRTIEFEGIITGLTSPRYIHFVSENKAYISDLYASHITIFNPKTLEITGTIDLEGHTSEQMVQVGKYVFVSHWVNGEDILVIDTETDQLIDKIEVPAQPKDLRVDKNGKIWALCGGSYANVEVEENPSALVRIDPETRTMEQIYRFSEGMFSSGLEMSAAGDSLYYLNKGIFKMAVNSRHLPDSAFIPEDEKLFYHLAVNQENNEIYIADAIDYTQDAVVYRYSQSGVLKDSFKVGINPSDFLFQ